MQVSFNPAADVEAAMFQAATAIGLDCAHFAPEVRAADPKHGDFQANGVLAFAKREKQNPRALAEKLLAALSPATRERYDVTIAGPGFINFALKPAALLEWLRTFTNRDALKTGAATAYAGKTWVVDYGSPNTAKQMHVGHLPSIIVGESISRLLEFSGAKVIRDNHLGDWGTQFGKILYGFTHFLDREALARDPLEEFERLYKAANTACAADPAALEETRLELVRLQRGDADATAIWETVNRVSIETLQTIYQRLGVRYDHFLGESFYRDRVAQVYQELTDLKIAQESEGALVVFHPEHPRFATQPFIIRKSDGASNYASTDLATMLYRTEYFHADGIVIETDTRQSDHIEQLWLTTQKWFRATNRPLPLFQHVTHGTILGEDGKAIKTRSGDPIRLKTLLDEAVERAYAVVTEKNAELPEEERREIANTIGLGAVVYGDLSQNRSSDIMFSWDKMLSLDGNTAPYLLYAVARIHSIFRKAAATPGDPASETAAAPLETPNEIAIARKLVKFADAVRLATDTLRPHFLSLYLYELAGEYSSFNNADKVLVDDPAIRARRLLLCARTLLVLETGLDLLGLRTLQRM